MAKKKQVETVFIIHAQRGGKPTEMNKDKFEAAKMFIYIDGWRLANDKEVAQFYDIKVVEPETVKVKETEDKEQK